MAKGCARKVDFGARNYGDILGLSKEILTFNEQMEDLPTLRAMRSQLASARRIVFLGFHFHQQNMDLLKITSAGGGTSAEVYATVINRSPAEIDVIRKQIPETLGNVTNVETLGLTCVKLLDHFGTTFLRRIQ